MKVFVNVSKIVIVIRWKNIRSEHSKILRVFLRRIVFSHTEKLSFGEMSDLIARLARFFDGIENISKENDTI
jgi:hypothetical protein